jgi:hypothetical protein
MSFSRGRDVKPQTTLHLSFPPRCRGRGGLQVRSDTDFQSCLCIELNGSEPWVHGSTTDYEHPQVDFSVGAKA